MLHLLYMSNWKLYLSHKWYLSFSDKSKWCRRLTCVDSTVIIHLPWRAVTSKRHRLFSCVNWICWPSQPGQCSRRACRQQQHMASLYPYLPLWSHQHLACRRIQMLYMITDLTLYALLYWAQCPPAYKSTYLILFLLINIIPLSYQTEWMANRVPPFWKRGRAITNCLKL